MNRRQFVAGIGTAASVGIAGCLGVITGAEPAKFEAAPPSVAETALEETGYESAGVEEIVIEREVEAGGQSREVVVTNYLAQYEKPIDMGPLGEQRGATFTALTSPQVNVLGREFNPIAEMSTRELAEMVQQQYEGVENVEKQADIEVQMQGQTIIQSIFTAEAAFSGSTVDIGLLVTEAVELGEDLLVTVGASPQAGPDEEGNVLTLLKAVQSSE
jgi:hypothetical protein